MIKPTAVATMTLTFAAMPALAQGGNRRPAGTTVIGQTGKMYDGNSANLQLPPEQTPYWAQFWIQTGASGNSGPTSAVGAGTAGTSLGGTTGGGEHRPLSRTQ